MARATLVEALAYGAPTVMRACIVIIAPLTRIPSFRAEPGERLGHAAESLAAAARMLAVDVCTSALRDATGALKWLAVDGAAVMTTDARRALMHEINARKEADDAAAAEKQRASAAALEAARAAPADAPAPSGAAALEAAAASAWGAAVAQVAAGRDADAAPARMQAPPRQLSVAASLRSMIQCVQPACALFSCASLLTPCALFPVHPGEAARRRARIRRRPSSTPWRGWACCTWH